jgi:hypothetical protein
MQSQLTIAARFACPDWYLESASIHQANAFPHTSHTYILNRQAQKRLEKR